MGWSHDGEPDSLPARLPEAYLSGSGGFGHDPAGRDRQKGATVLVSARCKLFVRLFLLNETWVFAYTLSLRHNQADADDAWSRCVAVAATSPGLPWRVEFGVGRLQPPEGRTRFLGEVGAGGASGGGGKGPAGLGRANLLQDFHGPALAQAPRLSPGQEPLDPAADLARGLASQEAP